MCVGHNGFHVGFSEQGTRGERQLDLLVCQLVWKQARLRVLQITNTVVLLYHPSL